MVNRSVIDRVDFLRSLSAGAKDDVAARAVTRRFAAGAHLWSAGAEPRGLFVILTGRVRVVAAHGKRQHVIHTEEAGATIGEVPLFAGGSYPATAIAWGEVECLVLDRAALTSAIRANPEIAFVLLARLAERVRHLLGRLSARTADPAAARVAAYILARPVASDATFTLGLTQQQLAEEVGTVREVVVRLLRRFMADGTIERRGRGRYVLRDEELLRRHATGE